MTAAQSFAAGAIRQRGKMLAQDSAHFLNGGWHALAGMGARTINSDAA